MKPTPNTHPLILIAAGTVAIASLTAIAATLGWLPPRAMPGATAPVATASAASGIAPSATTVTLPAGTRLHIEPATPTRASATPAPSTVRAAVPRAAAPSTARADRAPTATRVAYPQPRPAVYAEADESRPRDTCRDCGTVTSVREVSTDAAASGLGAVAGGVLGGVVGNRFGKGGGRDVMTVIGAVGGAFAGHEVEKMQRQGRAYEISVRYDDGDSQVFTDSADRWRSGDRVRIVNDRITAL